MEVQLSSALFWGKLDTAWASLPKAWGAECPRHEILCNSQGFSETFKASVWARPVCQKLIFQGHCSTDRVGQDSGTRQHKFSSTIHVKRGQVAKHQSSKTTLQGTGGEIRIQLTFVFDHVLWSGCERRFELRPLGRDLLPGIQSQVGAPSCTEKQMSWARSQQDPHISCQSGEALAACSCREQHSCRRPLNDPGRREPTVRKQAATTFWKPRVGTQSFW